MADDIVTRLREYHFPCKCFGLDFGDCSRCLTEKQAADEIERLRKEVTTYKAAMYLVGGHSDDCLGDFGDEPCICGYDAAMNEFEASDND